MENKKIRIGIVAAEFNYDVTFAMVELAKEHAKFLDAEIVEIMKVPGTFDIPLGVKILLSKDNIDGVVTLGAVIEGQTEHDEVIAQQASRKIMDLSLEFNKPVALGISGPGMSRVEAHERVDYAKRAVEAVVKMCKIKFAHEEESKSVEAIEKSEKFANKEEKENVIKRKRGRPRKIEKKEKIETGIQETEKKESALKKIKDEEKNKIIEEIKNKGKITTGEVMRMFNVSKITAWAALKELTEEGKILRKGERNQTYYVLP